MHKGRVVFGAMDEVVFGRPAAAAVVEQTDRLRASRAFLMVSGTLNRQTDEIDKIRRALGPRYAGMFDAMPPHTPREAVIAAANQARSANADLIVTVGAINAGDAPPAALSLSMPSTSPTSLARQSCTALAPSVIEPPPTVTIRSASDARA